MWKKLGSQEAAVNYIKIQKKRCLNIPLTIVVESTHLKNMFVKLDDVNKYITNIDENKNIFETTFIGIPFTRKKW